MIPWNIQVFSLHGILQARILEWVAIPFSEGSSWPRDQTQDSCIAGRFFTVCAKGRGKPFLVLTKAVYQKQLHLVCDWTTIAHDLTMPEACTGPSPRGVDPHQGEGGRGQREKSSVKGKGDFELKLPLRRTGTVCRQCVRSSLKVWLWWVITARALTQPSAHTSPSCSNTSLLWDRGAGAGRRKNTHLKEMESTYLNLKASYLATCDPTMHAIGQWQPLSREDALPHTWLRL